MTPGLATAGLAVGLLLAGAPRRDGRACEEVRLLRAKPMMATVVTVTVRGCAGDDLERPVRESFAEAARLAAILSEWDPDSSLSLLNSKAGVTPVRVPRELQEVLQISSRISALTSGAFDATWAPLGDLWRFDGAGPPRLPAAEEVERRRALVGYRHLILAPQDGTAFLERPGMRIGLGGVAKGYIAEAMADLLVARGVHDVLVAASGDIAARGRNGDRPWTVAVQDPREPSGVGAVVELQDESISTSGDYERFFVIGGRRYHHILDPSTGYPSAGSASVTVVAPHGAVADALATGLFVLGPERGAAVVRGLPGVSALLVADDGSARVAGDARRFGAPARQAPSVSRPPPCRGPGPDL